MLIGAEACNQNFELLMSTNGNMKDLEIRVVAFQAGEQWIVQGLEYDVGTQGASISEAFRRFFVTMTAEIGVSLSMGQEPLAGIDRAPQKFWDMWNSATDSYDGKVPDVSFQDGITAPHIIPDVRVAERVAV